MQCRSVLDVSLARAVSIGRATNALENVNGSCLHV